MKTRKEIEVALERAGVELANMLREIYPESINVRKWDRAHGDWQQINHLTGTVSYDDLVTENAALKHGLAAQEQAGGVAPSFDCSLAAIDQHDPQSFINGAKWAQDRLASMSAGASGAKEGA